MFIIAEHCASRSVIVIFYVVYIGHRFRMMNLDQDIKRKTADKEDSSFVECLGKLQGKTTMLMYSNTDILEVFIRKFEDKLKQQTAQMKERNHVKKEISILKQEISNGFVRIQNNVKEISEKII